MDILESLKMTNMMKHYKQMQQKHDNERAASSIYLKKTWSSVMGFKEMTEILQVKFTVAYDNYVQLMNKW